MKPEDPDGPSAPWTAGTVSVLRSEAERLRAVSRSLEDQAVEVRQIDPHGWSGPGHDAYLGRRTELAARCRMVAEEHGRAARALDDFVAVLEQLTRSARDTSDPSLIRRLAAQRTEAATLAAATLTEVGRELAALKTVLGEVDRRVVRESRPSRAEKPISPPPDTAHGQTELAPALLLADPAEFDRRLQGLNDAMWRFWSLPPLVKPVANKGSP
ncbi:hypothetical protein DL991_25570 [Amycolatopsis sp. WAC 01375]|uniref:hypothetical protein n=1 Tax=unclassified Amycolatopsis TaxID=2618356 RepID=UPI000F7BAB14|nr:MULTISPECIES: hypothetical protein [unclassified Amycolatopsis]RSM76563.1 hypothetical protein DL991_25570 [Amycolatopsis sp. WAC 01375]RSN33214.1 hypothetical protein DL990_14525 [Amycolatopsis sp. WAC 01416]